MTARDWLIEITRFLAALLCFVGWAAVLILASF